MRSAGEFRAWATKQWRAHWPGWLAGTNSPRWWPLHPPTETTMSGDPDAVANWVGGWQRQARADGVTVQWVEKQWRAHGAQHLPARATATPAAMARLARSLAG